MITSSLYWWLLTFIDHSKTHGVYLRRSPARLPPTAIPWATEPSWCPAVAMARTGQEKDKYGCVYYGYTIYLIIYSYHTHVCIYIDIHTVYIYMYIDMYVYIYVLIYQNTYTDTYVYIYIYVHIHAYIRIYIYILYDICIHILVGGLEHNMHCSI